MIKTSNMLICMLIYIRHGRFSLFLTITARHELWASFGSKTPEDYQNCGLYTKTNVGKHVIFFKFLKSSKFHQLCDVISRQPLITSTYIYTFWKRENQPDKSFRSDEPPKNDSSSLFWCFNSRCFSVLITCKISQNMTENGQFNKKLPLQNTHF